ncbi:MAG: GNAT family N-acetyltransferase [Candidatus Berkelbacteria bacterium]
MNKPLVDLNFQIPEKLETDQFRLRMLTINDVAKDYDAVMTSVQHLQNTFDDNAWPSPDLTFEQDLIDLGWHQKEFQKRSSFAYTMMSLDESQCLGCVYIYPTDTPGFDAKVYLWVRQSEFEKGFDPILFEAVKKWLSEKWPFEKVEYPGRI